MFQEKVLLIDADLRRPVQHTILGVSNRFGLTNVLLRDVPVEEAIKATSVPNLHFLPSGRLPRSSLGVLDPKRIRELISSLQRSLAKEPANRYPDVRSMMTAIHAINPMARHEEEPGSALVVAVVIDHGLGVVSLYAHLSAMDVRDGDVVSAGQIVGRVGATGRVTGAHLHWTVRVSGARVDPLSLLAMLGTRATVK